MSAVVSAVTSVFKAVGNAVGDIVEGVGNLVENIVDEVVEPVVKAVGNTIEAAMDDPLGTIAKIGVAVFAPELLPAFNFGYSVANGVPLEKALINTGLNMAGAEIGTFAGNQLTCTFDLSCAASNAVTSAAKGAASATLKGQNALCGAVGSLTNNLVNSAANSAYKCLSRSLSGCTSSGGLPVTAGSVDGDCAVGCASTQNLGALPSGASTTTASDDTVCVAGSQDACTDVTCTGGLTRGLGTVGSTETTNLGGLTVTGKRDTCTDLTCVGGLGTTSTTPVCTFNQNTTDADKGTLVVTGKKEACCVTCTTPTLTVTGSRDTCDTDCDTCDTCDTCDSTCTSTTSLPTVTVTAKREACCVTCTCDCDCEDKTKVTLPKVNVPKINFPKTKAVKKVGALSGAGCGAIPWLDTRDSLLRNQIVFDSPEQEKAHQARVHDIYGRMDECLAKEMQDRYGGVPQIKLNPFGEQEGGLPETGLAHGGRFAGGGTSSCVASCSFSYCYNQDAKYMPKFVNCGPDFLTNSAASKRQPLTHKQLTHLQQRISNMGNMGGLAAGGLPKKYQDAMPKDHNPEFVTGMTGYYACGGGTGQSDDIPAMLHDGDYVMDADVVAALGDGSSKAGREVLEGFRGQISHSEKAQGKPVPAKIADGEYVFPAGFVTALGGGDNKAGAKILDGLREKLRAHKRSAPTSKIPPKAKSPLDYIKQTKG